MSDDFWNQWPGVILGAEDNGESEDPNDEGEEDPDDPDDPEGEGHEDDPEAKEEKSKDDFAALEKALAAERRVVKRLERENRRLASSKETKEAEKDETVEEAKQREQLATQKAEKLAAGLLKRDIDQAIKDAARELKFLDVEDALNLVDRTKITYDQDDEDPTDIDIDEDTVKAAVKALATRKPHFINRGTDDGEATGSQFGGSRKKKQAAEDTLKELYPSL